MSRGTSDRFALVVDHLVEVGVVESREECAHVDEKDAIDKPIDHEAPGCPARADTETSYGVMKHTKIIAHAMTISQYWMPIMCGERMYQGRCMRLTLRCSSIRRRSHVASTLPMCFASISRTMAIPSGNSAGTPLRNVLNLSGSTEPGTIELRFVDLDRKIFVMLMA